MGVSKLAEQLGIMVRDATELKVKVAARIPSVVALNDAVKKRFKMGQSIRTLGGRVYHCEPPKDGKTFDYKALNVLIQGSAADQAKEAVIYVNERLLPGERIISFVHDEMSVSCPPERVEAVSQIMREAAMALPCDTPMLMDIKFGSNWMEAK